MTAQPNPSDSSLDRRSARRLSSECRVKITIEPLEIEGWTENVSADNVLVFTDADVRATVELMSDGVVKCVPGRLVRRETLPDGRSGWAVEFDR